MQALIFFFFFKHCISDIIHKMEERNLSWSFQSRQLSLCFNSNIYFILYTGNKVLPFRPRCQKVNLRLCEFRFLKFFSLKTIVSERIQYGAKLLPSVEGQKLHGAKITLSKVFKRQLAKRTITY